MPAIDFPAAPAVNDEYSFEGRTWRWNGTGWEVKEYPAALLAGTAANPSLYFSGDPNTGLYSPGADQVAISTGGTGRLFVDASGNVGIGTAAFPYATTNRVCLDINGTTSSLINLKVGTTPISTITASASAATFEGGTGIPFIFYTNASERLRITSTGNVGIGTSSPAVTLDVTGQIRSYSTGANPYVSANNGTINNYLAVNATSGTVGTSSNHPLVFLVNDTERLRIDSTGNVGIGTSLPLGTLHLKHATDANIFFRNSTAAGLATGTIIDCFNDATSAATPLFTRASQLAFGTDSAGTFVERLRIDSSGNVGIGTSAPGSALDVRFATSPATDNGVGDNALRVWTTSALAANAGGAISLGGTATNSPSQAAFGQIAGRKDNSTSANYAGYLQFATNSSGGTMVERMRITSAGNVGIGTSSPSVALDVVAGIRGQALDATGSAVLFSSAGGGVLYHNGSGTAVLRAYSNGSGAAGNLTFNASGSENARIDSSGRLLVGTSTSASVGALVQVRAGAGNNHIEAIRSSDDAGSAAIWLSKSRGTAGSPTEVSNGDQLGFIVFRGHDGTDYRDAAYIYAEADGTWTDGGDTTDNPSRLVLSTTADGAASPTERMRIGNNGNTYVGTTAAVYAAGERLSISPNASSNAIGIALENTDNVGIGIYHGYTATGSAIALQFQDHNAVVRGSITVTTSATAYNTSSDYRLKENVAAVTDGITRLQQLKPSRFNFISDPAKTVDGFIAHEVQTVVPEAITGEKDAVDDDGNPVYQGIDQSKLVPLLTAALQEAVAKIESLEARLTAAGL